MPVHRLARSTGANKEDYPVRISTQSDVTAEIFGGIECISRLKEAGYDAIDWSFFEMSSGRG